MNELNLRHRRCLCFSCHLSSPCLIPRLFYISLILFFLWSLFKSFFFLMEIPLCYYQTLKAGSFTCSFTDTWLSPEDTASSVIASVGAHLFQSQKLSLPGVLSCCSFLVVTLYLLITPQCFWGSFYFPCHSTHPPQPPGQSISSTEN